MTMIDFGVQSSGDESSKAINRVWNDLLEIFYDDHSMGGSFKKLDDFQIIFRVSGDGDDFKGEGPEYLKLSSKGKTISIDFSVPEKRWKDIPALQFRQYISIGVNECFKLLREKAIELDKIKDLEKLDVDFRRGMDEFDSRS